MSKKELSVRGVLEEFMQIVDDSGKARDLPQRGDELGQLGVFEYTPVKALRDIEATNHIPGVNLNVKAGDVAYVMRLPALVNCLDGKPKFVLLHPGSNNWPVLENPVEGSDFEYATINVEFKD
tara:strand:- start:1222 stop:1590 length:369 start_codon:yes stop_codon:yes gene_type:complete